VFIKSQGCFDKKLIFEYETVGWLSKSLYCGSDFHSTPCLLLSWAQWMSCYVSTDAGYLCNKAAVLDKATKERTYMSWRKCYLSRNNTIIYPVNLKVTVKVKWCEEYWQFYIVQKTWSFNTCHWMQPVFLTHKVIIFHSILPLKSLYTQNHWIWLKKSLSKHVTFLHIQSDCHKNYPERHKCH